MAGLSINYDTWRGKFATFLRRRFRELITVLALAGIGVSTAGYCGYISQVNSLIATVLISLLTIAEAWIGFEIYVEATATARAKTTSSSVVSNVEYAEGYDGEEVNNSNSDLNEE